MTKPTDDSARDDDSRDELPTSQRKGVSGAANLGRDDDLIVFDDNDNGSTDSDAAGSTATGAGKAGKKSTAKERAAAKPAGASAAARADADDDVPYELREDKPAAGSEPKTGLVAEFRDLTGRQASWLVSNRETAAVSRSPLFYVTALVIGLGVIAGLIIGMAQKDGGPSGTPTMASVGLGPQAEMASQQLGVKITDVKSVEEAQQLVRDGKADAAFVPDPTGQGQDSIIALNSKPTAVMDKLRPEMKVTYLEPPAVQSEVAMPIGWALAALTIAAILTLGGALFSTMGAEKRNRITEVLAATISPRAAAWGRVWGLTLLSIGYLVIAAGVALLGMSIIGQTDLAVAMLPGLGWFAGIYLCTVFLSLGLFLWAATLAGRRSRQVFFGIVTVLVVVGAFLPMIFLKDRGILQILSYIPFTSVVATPMRFFASQAHWWEGLISLAIVLVVGLIVFALGSGAYRSNLLRGTGRGGKKAVAKKSAKTKAGKDARDEADDEADDAKPVKAGAKKPGATSAGTTAEARAADTADDE